MPRLVLWLLAIAIAAAVTAAVTILVTHLLDPDPDPTLVRIDTAASQFNPAGGDDPAEEYVCLVNEGESPVSLTGWRLLDAEGVVNVLSRFTLAPGQQVRVHPGDGGVPTEHDIFGDEGLPQWTNSGDTVTLENADGEEVDSQSFGTRDDGQASGSCGPPAPPPGSAAGAAGKSGAAPTGVQQVPPTTADRDCSEFATQAEAQAFFREQGVPAEDPHGLDADGDGEACESLP